MKIVSYNILSGGFEGYSYTSDTPKRLPLLKKALKKINAGFVGLVDTFRWDEIFSEKDLQKHFGYKYVYCINLNDERLKKIGHNNGITVLTNLPVTQFETIHLGTRDIIKARVTHNNAPLDIFSVYLDDKSEDTRIKQVKALWPHIDSAVPTILMGDFNSFYKPDLRDRVESSIAFLANTMKFATDLGPTLKEMKRAEVVELILQHGFVDASTDRDETAPTRLLPTPFDHAIFRIDYAFVTAQIKVTYWRVLKDRLFDTVSDHYPIVFEIE